MKTLISTTDFVLEQEHNYAHVTRDIKKNPFLLVVDYAKFLKQPLTLGMFVPCDKKGNVLEELKENYMNCRNGKFSEYKEAKEKVLFKAFEVNTLLDESTKRLTSPNGRFNIAWFNIEKGWYLSNGIEGMIVEELLSLDLELTESAIKQIGL